MGSSEFRADDAQLSRINEMRHQVYPSNVLFYIQGVGGARPPLETQAVFGGTDIAPRADDPCMRV